MRGVRISKLNSLTPFCPLQNPINAYAPFDGSLFEPTACEREFVADMPTNRVWSLAKESDGETYVHTGYMREADGWFVTAIAHKGNQPTAIWIPSEEDDVSD